MRNKRSFQPDDLLRNDDNQTASETVNEFLLQKVDEHSTGGVAVTFSVQPVSVIKPPPAREGALRFRSITQMLEHKHRASVGEQPKLYTKPIIRN